MKSTNSQKKLVIKKEDLRIKPRLKLKATKIEKHKKIYTRKIKHRKYKEL